MVILDLIISRLDYQNALYLVLSLKTAGKPQMVQNMLILLPIGVCYTEHISLVVKQLQGLPVCTIPTSRQVLEKS